MALPENAPTVEPPRLVTSDTFIWGLGLGRFPLRREGFESDIGRVNAYTGLDLKLEEIKRAYGLQRAWEFDVADPEGPQARFGGGTLQEIRQQFDHGAETFSREMRGWMALARGNWPAFKEIAQRYQENVVDGKENAFDQLRQEMNQAVTRFNIRSDLGEEISPYAKNADAAPAPAIDFKSFRAMRGSQIAKQENDGPAFKI